MNPLYFNIILTIGGDKTIFLHNFVAQTIIFSNLLQPLISLLRLKAKFIHITVQ